MENWFAKILRNPFTGDSLEFDEKACILRDTRGSTFQMAGDIPVFTNTPPQTDITFDYTRHYTKDAEIFDYFEEDNDPIQSKHLKMLRKTLTKKVPRQSLLLLDVGCGCAFVAKEFANSDKCVVSLDIALANAKKAFEKYHYKKHAAVVADAYQLPFADGTFDCIFASEIIEHTVNPQAFVASLLSKIKDNGTLLISTPYKEKIGYSLCVHCNCKTPHNAHLHSFDKKKIQNIVNSLPATIRNMQLVGNKALLRSHLITPLSKFGFYIWKFFDKTANLLIPKSEHFVITLTKNAQPQT